MKIKILQGTQVVTGGKLRDVSPGDEVEVSTATALVLIGSGRAEKCMDCVQVPNTTPKPAGRVVADSAGNQLRKK